MVPIKPTLLHTVGLPTLNTLYSIPDAYIGTMGATWLSAKSLSLANTISHIHALIKHK